VNLVDLIVLVVVALAAYRGWRRGALGQVFELGGGFLGLLAGIAAGPRFASIFTDEAGLQGALIALVVVFVLLSAGQAVGYLLGRRFGLMARRARLGGFDSALGTLFGALVTVVTFWLVGSLLVHGPWRPLARELRQSVVLRAVNRAAEPPDVLASIRHYLTTSGFPQVFAGLPRPAGPPVKLPSNALARKAVKAAQGSTVRIVMAACGGTQLGSGWIAEDATVVTNAHVVAGGQNPTVQEPGRDHAGEVVLFDPELDIAVIRVEGLEGGRLPLNRDDLDAGRPGAVLGYPGSEGGTLVTHPAAIQARFSALGRDIYGDSYVDREVYELRAKVREGDSGGPFVLPTGEVAGVVFAASTTDANSGYALTGSEVADEIRAGSRATEPVSTGGCTR
jgi:S1-C subfamily serine protease